MDAVKDMELVERNAAPVGSDVTLMFERLARDPQVDVDKLERLIDMHERVLRQQAEAEFWAAFATMQGEMPTITEDGEISVEGAIRSRYSTNENIQECIRPILMRHGFALTFRNATKENGVVCVTGVLGHSAGHKETDTFESAPDSGGKMNSIQRIGSTRSYGARYTTIALLNIVSRAPSDRDDDGHRAGQDVGPAPEGYDNWLTDLTAAADEGWPKLSDAFGKSNIEFRKRLTGPDKNQWALLRARAEKVKP